MLDFVHIPTNQNMCDITHKCTTDWLSDCHRIDGQG